MTGLRWFALLVLVAVVLQRLVLENKAVMPTNYHRRVVRSSFPFRRWGWYVGLGPAEPHPLNAIGSGFAISKLGARLASARSARRHRLRFVIGLESGYLETKRRLSVSEADRLRANWIRDHANARPHVIESDPA